MDFSKLRNPGDVKKLSPKELEDLAKFCREMILKRTAVYGGHVGPDLGVVEATIALCRVFDFPRDKIVWDVSHQDDVWKMLTGRMEAFTKPEPYSVIGEYTVPGEAPEYDLFYAGHTSPSISLSLGLARARDLKGEKFNIISFIGDGSLSGGEAFEGLNEAAVLRSNFIVVVNDNQMSIPHDHGGLYRNLRDLRESAGAATNNYFKAIGFDYMYLAEGNDMAKLSEVFARAKDSDWPVVVHINTQKGEGYAPAEAHREEFHAMPPYYIKTGTPRSVDPQPDIASVTRDYLLAKCESMPELLIVTTSTPEIFGFMEKERRQAGRHYLDLCICEQTGVSVTAGAAKGGIKPVYPVAGTFLQRAIDQMIEDLSLDNLPGVLITFYCGVYGIPDATHLGFWDIPLLTNTPNLVYLAPSGFREYTAMLDWALKQDKYPVAVRAPFGPVEDAEEKPDADYGDLNKFKIIRQGSEVAIIAAGAFFGRGRETADLLKKNGIEATLINPRFVSGIDEGMLKDLEKNHKLVITLEDGCVEGGFGAKIAQFYGLSLMKVLTRGVPKKFVDRYEVDEFLKECRLTPAQLAEDIKKAIK
ncbi:MAG: 1-deoxy-D-xylulose-5-phosphate synthase [Desulfovibrio sp.]|nr:1-deoxy-D-xylulose-5-phosphate synthase [Desulfovibrio sp.]